MYGFSNCPMHAHFGGNADLRLRKILIFNQHNLLNTDMPVCRLMKTFGLFGLAHYERILQVFLLRNLVFHHNLYVITHSSWTTWVYLLCITWY